MANGIATIEFTAASDEDLFEGLIKDGKMNGIGKLTKKDGSSVEGIWRDNQLQTYPEYSAAK